MNNLSTDIELIRKYFNGELSLDDQHRLEKRALEDPFLQDAMDGFEQFNVKQKDFDHLKKRLTNRVEKKEKVVIVWRFKQWSVAASLIFGVAAISIYFNQTPENKTIAVSELQKKERLPNSVKILEDTLVKLDADAITDVIVNSSSIVQNNILISAEMKGFSPADEITLEPMAQINAASIKDTLGLDEITLVGFAAQNKTELTSTVTRLKAEEFTKTGAKPTLASKVSDEAITRNGRQKTEQIVGKVTAIENGIALPGVQITNTKNGVIVSTDGKGEFKITAEENDELTTKYLGFLTETFAANKNDSLKISLKTNQNSISEVVVIDYGTKKSTEVFASPKNGWKEFRQYLDQAAVLDDGEMGRVVVQFIILPDGKLSDFFIQKSLTPLANSKAIQLIKAYQPWLGAANGKAQKVKVAVRFK